MLITDFQCLSEAHMQITFKLLNSQEANIEMNIDVQCQGAQVRQMMREISRIVDTNRYCLSHGGDCAVCDWHQLIALVSRCRDESRHYDHQTIVKLRMLKNAHYPSEVTAPNEQDKKTFDLFDDDIITTLKSIYLPDEMQQNQASKATPSV